MPINEYASTLEWLFDQFPSYQLIGSKAYKPTLDNTLKLVELFDEPHKSVQFIHIAGSNGKGSVSSMLASILQESGLKVGLFTSPHILDFRERIRVNGVMISEQDVIDYVAKIKSWNLSFNPSFFEITFAMALDYFKRSGCTICVIETGLGGRLDATNIITPLVSLITNISLEHTSILGNTHAEIAYEKAGIIKSKIPVVIGTASDVTKKVFLDRANSIDAPIYFAENFNSKQQYILPLLGSYQNENLKSVLNVLHILDINYGIKTASSVQKGLDNLSQNTGFFGRMQIIQRDPLVIFDVSHNLDGIKATLHYFQTLEYRKLFILYGSSSDKDVLPILQVLPDSADLHFTTFSNQRSLSSEELSSSAILAGKKAQIHSDAAQALKHIKASSLKNDVILVFGSFFLLSDLVK
jgi:dihydrofolate synthase/folylpolyglutamate synthase